MAHLQHQEPARIRGFWRQVHRLLAEPKPWPKPHQMPEAEARVEALMHNALSLLLWFSLSNQKCWEPSEIPSKTKHRKVVNIRIIRSTYHPVAVTFIGHCYWRSLAIIGFSSWHGGMSCRPVLRDLTHPLSVPGTPLEPPSCLKCEDSVKTPFLKQGFSHFMCKHLLLRQTTWNCIDIISAWITICYAFGGGIPKGWLVFYRADYASSV